MLRHYLNNGEQKWKKLQLTDLNLLNSHIISTVSIFFFLQVLEWVFCRKRIKKKKNRDNSMPCLTLCRIIFLGCMHDWHVANCGEYYIRFFNKQINYFKWWNMQQLHCFCFRFSNWPKNLNRFWCFIVFIFLQKKKKKIIFVLSKCAIRCWWVRLVSGKSI